MVTPILLDLNMPHITGHNQQNGQHTQFAPQPDLTSRLNKAGIKYVQSTTGSLLYYSRAVDPTLLVALNEISTSQAIPTETTKANVQWLLDYVATYPVQWLLDYVATYPTANPGFTKVI